MAPIRLGFVGVGGMGQCAHLRNYTQIADCQVVALAELQADLGKRVGERYGIARVYTAPRDMLAREELDGVVCIQQFGRHGAILPEVYAAGHPVLTEKPLANSVETAVGLLEALAQSKISHYVAYHKRSDPATIWARRQMEAWKAGGEVGALRYVRITMPPGDWIAGGFATRLSGDGPAPKLPADARPAQMTEEVFKQYCTFVNYYIHQVNLLRHLLGEDYRVDFADKAGRLLVARSQSRVTGVIEMAPYTTTRGWQEQAMVCFERAWLRIELPAPLTIGRPGRVTAYHDPGKETEPRTFSPQLPWVDAMQQQARHFVAALRGEATPLCRAEEALKDLETARDYLTAFN